MEFFGVIALGILGLWLLNPLVMRWWADGFANAGPVGDSFGALTSLFTGAAFVGLIATLMQQQREIRMQRQDLKLQREEMKAARSELEGQKEQMELQNLSLRQQMFEQTFFNLLNLFNQYIADLSQDHSHRREEPKSGRDQLEHILENLTTVSSRVATQLDQIGGFVVGKEARDRTSGEICDAVAERFLEDYKFHSNDLNSYFRLLYNILKLVKKAEVQDRRTYTNILRAQLSDGELHLLALNCATHKGEKLKDLSDEFDMLKHVPPKLPMGVDIHLVCKAVSHLEAASH
jgi:hypothetical protein